MVAMDALRCHDDDGNRVRSIALHNDAVLIVYWTLITSG